MIGKNLTAPAKSQRHISFAQKAHNPLILIIIFLRPTKNSPFKNSPIKHLPALLQ